MTQKSIFEKIAQRESPAQIIWEDIDHIAFLTIGPISKGHTLVVPKKNWGDYLFDLSNEKYNSLLQASKVVSSILEKNLDCQRILLWVEGFEVPHVHVHLIPAYKNFDIRNIQVGNPTQEDLRMIKNEILHD